LQKWAWMLRWRHMITFKSRWFQLIYILVKETVNFRDEAVRYHDPTVGKYSWIWWRAFQMKYGTNHHKIKFCVTGKLWRRLFLYVYTRAAGISDYKRKNLLFGCVRHHVCLGNERRDTSPWIRSDFVSHSCRQDSFLV
jgi:hypothetical protein